jgi:DNA repair exonuclease SbcCD ATPase subunit
MYSKITNIEVTNFMVYSHAKISFDKKGIINIKGYNSGGKSTMLKAIAVCLMNMYPKAQTKFIRHGEKYFRIVVNFDDGITIIRDKYITGQSLYEVYEDGACIFTTKEGNRLTKVDNIPKVVEDYLGLCVVSTGCLNYQVRQDKLWLIETTGSENYNSLNEILKTEELSRANALLNSDKNEVNAGIANTEARLQETNLSLHELNSYTDDLLSALENREMLCKGLVSKYKELKDITTLIEELNSLSNIPEVSKIDMNRYSGISSIDDTVKEIKGISSLPVCEKVNAKRVTSIDALMSTINTLKSMDLPLPEVDILDTAKEDGLVGIVSLLSEIKECSVEIKDIKAKQTKVSVKLGKAVKEAEKQGIKFVKCDNCGSYIEVLT